jgi:hypothetical protein
MGRTGPQAIAGAATSSSVASEPQDPGQRGLGSYQEADEPITALSVVHRTSSSDIRQDRRDPVDDNGGQPSGSDDDQHKVVSTLPCPHRHQS